MSKKSSELDLTPEQVTALSAAQDELPPDLQCLAPLFESLRQSYADKSNPHKNSLPTRAATDFQHTAAVAESLEVDYEYTNAEYLFMLRPRSETPKLSDHFALVIKDLKDNQYAKLEQINPSRGQCWI